MRHTLTLGARFWLHVFPLFAMTVLWPTVMVPAHQGMPQSGVEGARFIVSNFPADSPSTAANAARSVLELECGCQFTSIEVVTPKVSNFQPVLADVVVASENVSPSVLDPSAPCGVKPEPLVPQEGLKVFLRCWPRDGKDSVPPEDFFRASFPQGASLRCPLLRLV